jgi:Tfp pilus assembly protein PilF
MLASEEPPRGPEEAAVRGRAADPRLLFGVFALALAVRLAYAFEIRELPTLHQLVMDARRYDELAREILDHGWMPRAAFYQAPLYPYLVAAVYAVSGRSLAAVRLVQALAGSLTAVLAAVAAGRLWGGAAVRPRARAAAAIAGVLGALYAPAVFYTPLLLKTVPALLLESAALVLVLPPDGRGVRAGRGLAAGCALGGAALLQESLLLLAPAAALVILLERTPRRPPPPRPGRLPMDTDEPAPRGGGARRRAGAALALLAGTALALAPAALLNYAAGGELLLTSSQGGMNFYIGNARGASGTYTPLSSGSQAPERQREDARRLAAAIAARESGGQVGAVLAPAQVSRIFWRETLRQIGADPAAWLRLMLRKTRLFWNAYELPDAEGFRVYRRESWLLRCDPVGFGLVAPLAALGLLALARGGPAERRAALLLGSLTAAVWLAVVLFFVFGRYRLAVIPFLLPLAAAGAVELFVAAAGARAFTRRGAARPALDLALLAGVALAVDLPCYSSAEVRRQDAVIEYNLGTAAVRWSEATYGEYLRLAESERGGAAGEAGGGRGRVSATAGARLVRAAALASRGAGYLEDAARASPGFLAAELEWAIARQRRASYLANAGAFAEAADEYAAARQRLAAVLAAAPFRPANAGPSAAEPTGNDPELENEARRRLAALDAGAAAALNNLGVRLIATGRLDHAEQALARAVALAPASPGPRGSLALCWLERGQAERRSGAEAAARGRFEASRDGYREAVRLAAAAGRGDLAALYRRGLAAAEAALAR